MSVTAIRELSRPALRRHGVAVCYLFGSRAAAGDGDDSDIDLALLFRRFDPRVHTLDRELALEDELARILAPSPVDVVLLQRSGPAFRFEVVSTGVILYSEDEEFRTDFEERAIRDYLDFAPFLEAYYRDVREVVLGEQRR